MKPGAMMTSVNKRTYWTSRLKTWILDSKSRFESNLRLDFESKNHINLRSWATYSRRWPSYYQCRQFWTDELVEFYAVWQYWLLVLYELTNMSTTTWNQLSKKNNTHFRKIYRFHGWAISIRQVHAAIMHERTSIIVDTISGQMSHLLEFHNIFWIIFDVIFPKVNVGMLLCALTH